MTLRQSLDRRFRFSGPVAVRPTAVEVGLLVVDGHTFALVTDVIMDGVRKPLDPALRKGVYAGRSWPKSTTPSADGAEDKITAPRSRPDADIAAIRSIKSLPGQRVLHASPASAAGTQSPRGCNASFMLSTPRACTDRSARADRIAALRLRDPDTSESPSEPDTASSRPPRALSESSRSDCARSNDWDFEVFRIRTLFQNDTRHRQPVHNHCWPPATIQRFSPEIVALGDTGKYLQRPG